MMRFFFLCILSCGLFAAEEAEQSVSKEKRSKAEARAEALMKELAHKQAELGKEEWKDLADLDLLVRKAEAYVLVEQPIDAGRMMDQAHVLIKKHQADKRDAMSTKLKAYSNRLSSVAQIVLSHTATIDLSEKKPVKAPEAATQNDPEKSEPQAATESKTSE